MKRRPHSDDAWAVRPVTGDGTVDAIAGVIGNPLEKQHLDERIILTAHTFGHETPRAREQLWE